MGLKPCVVTDFTLLTCLGSGRDITLQALRNNRTGLVKRPFETVALDTWIGEVAGLDDKPLPPALFDFECRNNRLAWMGLLADDFIESVRQARDRYGPHRVGVFLGTSTSGILQTELAYRRRDPATGALPADFKYAQTHNAYSVADFVRTALALKGPAHVVSTACSSGAKVFGDAARMIECGLIDAAVVGGVDSLCLTTLYGFNSLELLSTEICRPWDTARKGLSIGEAAAFALLEKSADTPCAWLLGVGESSDGYHMSSPHPEGAGAAQAMREALQQAHLGPNQIDYINLHGTATPGNDSAEDLAVCAVFGDLSSPPPCSSTKGATGHTLGAAGAVEAAISILAIQHDITPGGLNRREPDQQLRSRYVDQTQTSATRAVLSNSFGFGGSNACLIFGRAATAAQVPSA
jgi:3-oxoacyl-[acyl-carrier-protein] synthase I